MDGRTRRRGFALFVLLAAAGVFAWAWIGAATDPARATSDGPLLVEPAVPPIETPTSLHLSALARGRSNPEVPRRNLFRFQTVPPGGATAAGPREELPEQAPPIARPPDAGLRNVIPLKFIGFVEGASTAGRVAILSDDRLVHHGREGDVVDGRYRIVRIGLESIELERLDGGARQTIRLTGS